MRKRLPAYVWLDGKVVRADRACVSVFDRGLQYGDGLFETLRVYDGQVFAVDEHLARLRASARFLDLPVPRRSWDAAIAELLDRNALRDDAWVRIVLTRGPAAPALLPPNRVKPTLILLAGRLDPRLIKLARRGVRVELLPFAVEGPLAGHKILSYLPALLGKRIARRHDAYEGLYVDRRGRLSEGTTSNIFVVDRDKIVTPAEVGILPGVTRRKVIELARRLGFSVRETAVRADVLTNAGEAFLSSSLAEIVPIIGVGEHRVGSGKPGRITAQLQAAYKTMVRETLHL